MKTKWWLIFVETYCIALAHVFFACFWPTLGRKTKRRKARKNVLLLRRAGKMDLACRGGPSPLEKMPG